jgi:decaprenylphospho-beta-D-erythro-pentofuranosid-2-ulose 2-reductase
VSLPEAQISSILLLGATSEIALAIARRCAAAKARVALAARSVGRLEADAEDIRIRYGSEVTLHEFDVLDIEQHAKFLDSIGVLPDVVVCLVGLMEPQADLLVNSANARRVMETNYVAPVLLLGEIANRMEARNRGTIVGVSSVAGDRGRASNYIYGSAKAGFAAFLSGLRARLSRSTVHVITVNPGFVATRMTAGKNLPRLLTAQPDEVAEAILRAARKRQDVIYVKPIWRVIMGMIGLMPERKFKTLKF